MSDPHPIAVAEVREVLAEVERAMAMYELGHRLGEDQDTLDEYGYAAYDLLGRALGIDPNGRAALAIVTALADGGRPHRMAGEMLATFLRFDETGIAQGLEAHR